MEQKKYVFHVSRGSDKHERFELTEKELEPKHRKMLIGQLRQVWNNTPDEQQREFLHEMAKEAAEKIASRIFGEFEERAELDDRIDEIIKEFRKDNSEELFDMIKKVHKDYDYVNIKVRNGKLEVKIHDGVQKFT